MAYRRRKSRPTTRRRAGTGRRSASKVRKPRGQTVTVKIVQASNDERLMVPRGYVRRK